MSNIIIIQDTLKNNVLIYNQESIQNASVISFEQTIPVKGDKGDTGAKGDKGDTGSQGAQGLKGDKGDTGSQGIQGVKGDKGDTGAQGVQGMQGIKGETGATGSQGLKGDKGDAGAQGIQGLQGIQGIQGEKGDSWVADTLEAQLDFGKGNQAASVTVPFELMNLSKIIQVFYTSNLEEVAILDMRVTEKSRTAGVGFDIIGVAPNGAFGTYNIRCIVSGE